MRRVRRPQVRIRAGAETDGRRNSRGLQASVTVEASYVAPIVMMVVLGIIMLSFFLYNRIKLGADVDECARYILAQGLDADEAEAELAARLTGYFAADVGEYEVTVSDDTVTITVTLLSRITPDLWLLLPAEQFSRIDCVTTVNHSDRCRIMRMLRAGEDLMSLLNKTIGG